MVVLTKSLLEKMYNEDKKSIRKIALELSVGKTTVDYYIKKFEINVRTHQQARKLCLREYGWTRGLTKEKDERVAKLAKNIKRAYSIKRKEKIEKIEKRFGKSLKDLIQELYWNRKMSQKQVSENLNMDRTIIINLMKKFGIQKRPKYEYISSLKGKDNALFGKKWDILLGKERSDKRKKEHSSRFRELTIKRLEKNEFPFFDTKIEKIMANELLRRKIPFVKQFSFENKFVVDFAIPFLKIVIECDGDYWHAKPRVYSSKILTFHQKKNLQRDLIKDNFLSKRGWIVLRFFESDILKNINKCMDIIESTIKSEPELSMKKNLLIVS